MEHTSYPSVLSDWASRQWTKSGL